MAIGDRDIDIDHKKLIQLINAVEKYIDEWNPVILSEILKRVKDYCQIHFVREEVIMSRLGFPDYRTHAALHQETEKKFLLIYDKYHQSDDPENQRTCARILLKVLNDYIINHVLKDDLKLGMYIKNSVKQNNSSSISRETQEFFAKVKKTVLIVDGVDYMRKQIGLNLRKAGIADTVEANEGGKAFDYLKAAPDLYGLVIADRHVDPTNGLHLLRILRLDEATPAALRTIPFIMLSSDDSKKGLQESLDAGANDVVVKPFPPIQLINAVLKALKTASPSGA